MNSLPDRHQLAGDIEKVFDELRQAKEELEIERRNNADLLKRLDNEVSRLASRLHTTQKQLDDRDERISTLMLSDHMNVKRAEQIGVILDLVEQAIALAQQRYRELAIEDAAVRSGERLPFDPEGDREETERQAATA